MLVRLAAFATAARKESPQQPCLLVANNMVMNRNEKKSGFSWREMMTAMDVGANVRVAVFSHFNRLHAICIDCMTVSR